MDDRRQRWALVAILVLAALLRIAVIATDGDYSPQNDAFEYDYYAHSIAAGHGYPESGYLRQGGPTAIRGPGYPYFLGGVYAVSGDNRTAGRLAGALLGVLAVFFVYLIGRRIWGRRVGLIAGALAAVFPPFVLLGRELWSETLFIPLELGAVLCVLEFRRSGGRLRWAAGAGALCGFALLTRNTAAPLFVCIPLGMIVAPFRLTLASLRAPLAVLGVAALVVAPWTIRNQAEFGRLIPVTTSAGITAAGVYAPASFDSGTHGAWRSPQVIPRFAPLFDTPGIDEAEVDSTLRREARDFAREHPGYVAEVFAWNLARMFELTGGSVVDGSGEIVAERGIGSATPAAERIGLLLAAALAACGLAAILTSRGRGSDRESAAFFPTGPLFLWLIPALTLVATALLNGVPRDRLPIDPFLLLAAAIGLAWLLDLYGRQEWSAT
jgi:4-amino-4-deoxy-L-arabinose transferase-like glycosyltransferase